MIKKFFFTSTLLASSLVSAESAYIDKLGMSFNLDLLMGGDVFAAITFTDGTSETVKAGSGIGFGAGITYQVDDKIKAETRLSYLSDSASGETSGGSTLEFDFTRYPLDFMGFYQHGKPSFGAGLTYHMSPTFSDGEDDFEFDSNLGTVFEYRYFYTKAASINLKMVNISYDYKDTSFNGSSFGIGIAGHF